MLKACENKCETAAVVKRIKECVSEDKRYRWNLMTNASEMNFLLNHFKGYSTSEKFLNEILLTTQVANRYFIDTPIRQFSNNRRYYPKNNGI